MMTEDEAKTKWCPFARCAGTYEGHNFFAANRFGNTPEDAPSGLREPTRCIGSACMAWRWEEMTLPDVTHGFCGLAGRPE